MSNLVEESRQTIVALNQLMAELNSHALKLRNEVARLSVLLDRMDAGG